MQIISIKKYQPGLLAMGTRMGPSALSASDARPPSTLINGEPINVKCDLT
mgnify:CR=1 FL=1